ncbi:MAG: PhnA domain-containing protein [Gammaproteobacteria bacterium]
MTIEQTLMDRSGSKCELCAAETALSVYEVPPTSVADAEKCILICETCREQIENPDEMIAEHWRCLNDSMWTPVPAVQVTAWRLLKRLQAENWAQGLLDMLYLDEETLQWAEVSASTGGSDGAVCKDSNGTPLAAGDSVTLIKDLEVKGAGFTAKRGTLVKNIVLTDNPEQIEGRVNGIRIVLLSKFLKKA